MQIETSPFVFEGPVPPEQLAGRERELAALRDRATHGRFVLLYGPRRFGKTSIIHRLRSDAELDRDLVVLVVDLQGVLTLDEISHRLTAAYERLTPTRVRDTVTRLLAAVADAAARGAGRKVGLDLGAGIVRAPEDPPASTLEALLDIPYDAAKRAGTRFLVVLDEFQAVADVDRAAAVVRARIQHQRDRVSYLFSGSEQGVLAALFADRAAPLYGQAERFELGPLPADVAADYVAGRFDETERSAGDGLGPLVETASGHPQRLNLLAHHLWGEVEPGGSASKEDWVSALELSLAHARPEFDAIWASLIGSQRRALRLAAWGEPLHGAAASRLSLGGGAGTAAKKALIRASILTEGATVIDPLLAVWLRRQYPAP